MGRNASKWGTQREKPRNSYLKLYHQHYKNVMLMPFGNSLWATVKLVIRIEKSIFFFNLKVMSGLNLSTKYYKCTFTFLRGIAPNA